MIPASRRNKSKWVNKKAEKKLCKSLAKLQKNYLIPDEHVQDLKQCIALIAAPLSKSEDCQWSVQGTANLFPVPPEANEDGDNNAANNNEDSDDSEARTQTRRQHTHTHTQTNFKTQRAMTQLGTTKISRMPQQWS